MEDRSCQVARFEPLRVDQLQGDLLAWRPDQDQLAYVAPAASSNWYAGTLEMVQGPEYAEPVVMAPDTLVFGDLTWSPDGALLAYVALRISDGVYTIQTVSPEEGIPKDWLPGEVARTENGSSAKAIIGWQAGQRLRVLSACGPDCDQTLEINLATGEVSAIGEQLRRAKDRLALRDHLVIHDEETYPYMIQPNWSHDNRMIAYFDEDDRVMLVIVAEQVQYILDVGINTPRETKWSYDNRHLAVRTDDWVYIFDPVCERENEPASPTMTP